MEIENSFIESMKTQKILYKLLAGRYKKYPYSPLNSRYHTLKASYLRSVLRDQKRIRDMGVDRVLEHMVKEKYLYEVNKGGIAGLHYCISEWYMKAIEASYGEVPEVLCALPGTVFEVKGMAAENS